MIAFYQKFATSVTKGPSFSMMMKKKKKRQLILTMVLVFLVISILLRKNTVITQFQVDRVDKVKSLEKRRMVDIISIGSTTQTPLQDAQQRTFGSHGAVRSFFRITEMNDTDLECSVKLTPDQVAETASFCKSRKHKSYLETSELPDLFYDTRSVGWTCAQKRPIDGLYSVLKKYRYGEIDIPHYVFIIDDDTFINMDTLNSILFTEFPYETPQLVAGCYFVMSMSYRMNFPYGGFGTFVSQASIHRLLQPIHCTTENANNGVLQDAFSRFACWRIQENNIGEQEFFADGMSVIDLMYVYSAEQPFMKISNWSAGFCFHSDHFFGYFFNAYHIAVPDSELEANFNVTDALRMQYHFQALTNTTTSFRKFGTGECFIEKEMCQVNSPVCHYIHPNQMDDLFHNQTRQDMDHFLPYELENR
jgi:hypothetical protein